MSGNQQEEQRSDSVRLCANLLTDYIRWYNERNMDKIIECLDEDLEVFLNGSLAMKGRDTIAPTYIDDFKTDATVEMEFLEKSESSDEIALFVHLVKQIPLVTQDVHLNVRYVFSKKNNHRMIRHEIEKVWTSENKQ